MTQKIDREWFGRARLGLFTHYTYATYPTADNYGGTKRAAGDMSEGKSVEEVASLFDAEKFAQAAADMGAQYVVFTVCHAGFNLLFPSETMLERGMTEKCSKTDVVEKLLGALGKYGIPLVLYMPPNDDHDLKPFEREKMGWSTEDGRESFINKLLREIGRRYNGRIAGIWFDQCGPRPSAREAAREYNPDAALFVNIGRPDNDEKTSITDFLVSEFGGPFPSGDSDVLPSHCSQVNRVIGGNWLAYGGKAASDPCNLYRYLVRVSATEGQLNCGVNYACGPYLDQSWEDGVRELMHGLGELVRKNAYAIYDTLPGKSFVTKPHTALAHDMWGVSTESLDGKSVYLHVLNAPENGILTLDRTADGRRFTKAWLGNREKELDFDGARIILPKAPDPIDTVITLA